MAKVKVRKVHLRHRDCEMLDYAGRVYAHVDFDNLNWRAENLLELINIELKEHGVEMVLGDEGDYYGIRAEKLKGGK